MKRILTVILRTLGGDDRTRLQMLRDLGI